MTPTPPPRWLTDALGVSPLLDAYESASGADRLPALEAVVDATDTVAARTASAQAAVARVASITTTLESLESELVELTEAVLRAGAPGGSAWRPFPDDYIRHVDALRDLLTGVDLPRMQMVAGGAFVGRGEPPVVRS